MYLHEEPNGKQAKQGHCKEVDDLRPRHLFRQRKLFALPKKFCIPKKKELMLTSSFHTLQTFKQTVNI